MPRFIQVDPGTFIKPILKGHSCAHKTSESEAVRHPMKHSKNRGMA